MNAFIFSATAGQKDDCLLYKENGNDFDIFFKENNTQPIAKVYNRAIDFAIEEKFDYLVLCHDDIIIESNLRKVISQVMRQFDIAGVAGTTQCKLEAPALWHIMGGGVNSGNLHGAVAHGNSTQKQMTSFGVYPKRVVLIDGVFMIIKRKVFEKVRFDEECPASFHFYDLNYSLQCHKEGFKVGVSDIMITHASPGLREFTDEFNKGQEWFLQKWKGKL